MAALLNLILSHPYATLMLLAAICAVIRFVPAAGGSSTPAFAGYSSDDSCGDQGGNVKGFDGGGFDFGGSF